MGHLVQYRLEVDEEDVSLFEEVRSWCEDEFDAVGDDGYSIISFEAYHPYSYDLAHELEEAELYGVRVSAWYLERDPDDSVVTSKGGGGFSGGV